MDASITQLTCDLETLDTTPSAIVLQCAFTSFSLADVLQESVLENGNPTLLADELIVNYLRRRTVCIDLPIVEQLALGRTLSKSTCDWWMKQANTLSYLPGSMWVAGGVKQCLESLFSTLDQTIIGKTTRWWAKSPRFDWVIFDSLAAQVGFKTPDKTFRNEDDIRNYEHDWPHLMVNMKTLGLTPHLAADDAIAEAFFVIKVQHQIMLAQAWLNNEQRVTNVVKELVKE